MAAMLDLTAGTNRAAAEPDVRAQLDRIIHSPWFSAADLLAAFLRFIVEEHLAGRDDYVKERTVALKVFGRDHHFDPRVDTVVRTGACRLRRALAGYYQTEGAGDAIRIEVLKGSYRPTIRYAALQPDPNGHGRESTVPDASPSRSMHQRACPVIAVLPLSAPGDDELDRFLAECIAHKLTVELGRLPLFAVLDYTVTSAIAAQGLDPLQLAARLHADYLVTGSVCSNSTVLRVTCQVAHGHSGIQLWGKCINATRSDECAAFDLVDRIVDEVVGTIGDVYGVIAEGLGQELSSQAGPQYPLLEAILRHFQFQLRFVPQDLAGVIELVERAVESNPQCAWGWSALAHLNLEAYATLIEIPEALERAWSYLDRAISLSPQDAYVHWVRGLYYTFCGMPDEMMEALDRTVELCGYSPFLLGATGALLATTSEHKRGQELLDRAAQLNPRYPGWFLWGRFLSQYRAGQYEEAVTTAENFSLPDVHWDYLFRSAALAQAGRTAECRLQLRRACELQPAIAEAPDKVLGRLLIDGELRSHLLDGFGQPLGLGRRSLKRPRVEPYAASVSPSRSPGGSVKRPVKQATVSKVPRCGNP